MVYLVILALSRNINEYKKINITQKSVLPKIKINNNLYFKPAIYFFNCLELDPSIILSSLSISTTTDILLNSAGV